MRSRSADLAQPPGRQRYFRPLGRSQQAVKSRSFASACAHRPVRFEDLEVTRVQVSGTQSKNPSDRTAGNKRIGKKTRPLQSSCEEHLASILYHCVRAARVYGGALERASF